MASARMSAKCTRSTVLGIESTFSGIQSTFFRDLVNLFRKAILIKRTFSHEELMRSSLGRLSVFARQNKARYKRRKRNGNLNKQHFFDKISQIRYYRRSCLPCTALPYSHSAA